MGIFSSKKELSAIETILFNYLRLPFSGQTIPGSIMEAVLGKVRNGKVLNTYDFVDVVSDDGKCGWQVKSTKSKTPVTWKRAKIPNADALVEKSLRNEKGLQELGDAIINFCNSHAQESMKHYGLTEIGYARLIMGDKGEIAYFERLLCSKDKPNIFNPADFTWRWSTPKKTVKKEQLSALHGKNIKTNEKWWAWHGLGENQLHFSGEKAWWPDKKSAQTIAFAFPSEGKKLSLDALVDFLSEVDARN